MNEISRIPPVQLPVTTIATNITQTPQTPLDQKVALTKPEKTVVEKKKRRKKDQVTINEQHWTMLKERREIDELRELQIVLLFSQLLQQGLSHLQYSIHQIKGKLTPEQLEQSAVRQALPIFYQELLGKLNKKIEPIEKQLKFLVEKGPQLIEAHQSYWQIKNRKQTFPVQIMLPTFEEEFRTVVFPNTLEAEKILAKKAEELIVMKEHLDGEKQKASEEQGVLEKYEKKFKEAEEQRKNKQKDVNYLERLAESKEIEHAYVQKKVRQMELIHPLKRKQHEYQAYVLREQIIQQELSIAVTEVKKAAEIYHGVEKLALHRKKEFLAIQNQERIAKEYLMDLHKDYQRALQEELELSQAFQRKFQKAYEDLATVFEDYLIDIYEEQAKSVLLEKYYREQLTETLDELKQILKQAKKPVKKQVLDYIKHELISDQAATLLSQANADAVNVQYLLEDKR